MEKDLVPFDLAKKLNQKGFNFDNYPTISQALKWIREEKELYVVILPYASIATTFKVFFCWHYRYNNDGLFLETKVVDDSEYPSYEQAAIAAIEYIIDNLL